MSAESFPRHKKGAGYQNTATVPISSTSMRSQMPDQKLGLVGDDLIPQRCHVNVKMTAGVGLDLGMLCAASRLIGEARWCDKVLVANDVKNRAPDL